MENVREMSPMGTSTGKTEEKFKTSYVTRIG